MSCSGVGVKNKRWEYALQEQDHMPFCVFLDVVVGVCSMYILCDV